LNIQFTTRDILISSAVLSGMALVGGMLYQGIFFGGMLSFILAANVAPLGLGILIFWTLKTIQWTQRQKEDSSL